MNRVALLIACLFISVIAFAQSPKAIEADLLKSFKKINYWSHAESDNAADMLYKANNDFALKLKKHITDKGYPATYPFTLLNKEGLSISTSADDLFRIFSWDDGSGGTMRFSRNVFQFTTGAKNMVAMDTTREEGDSGVFYKKIYTLKADGSTYYLSPFLAIGSTRTYLYGIKIFTIENSTLNKEVKLIKTKSGLHNQLTFDYDAVLSDDKIKPDFYYDAAKQTIRFPITIDAGKITRNFITYKFTGKYFEKVK